MQERPDEIEIDTGVIQARVAKKGRLLIPAVSRDGVEILRNGRLVKTIDTLASKTSVRQAVYSASFANGTHKLMVKVLATSKRPRVDIDGVEFYSPHTSAPSVTV